MIAMTENTFSKIHAITGPLEITLKTLAENPNSSDAGRAQAKKNLVAVQTLNEKGHGLMHAAIAMQSTGFGLGSSSSTSREG
jgi:hypothetical protein